MRIRTFELERSQTRWENTVEINLTESGVHAASLADILDADELAALSALPLGYGHTDGTPALRAAVAAWHPSATPANVAVANGVSEANLLALTALAHPGDEIVVIVPNFMQLDGLAEGLGVDVRRAALDEAAGWRPDLAAIDAAIGPRTRLVTLCDPNNPSGTVLGDEDRRALAALTARRGVWLHVDEIYRGSEIDADPEALPSTAWGLGEHVVVTGGLAKSFGCPGLRMGWLVAPEPIVAEAHRRQDYTTIGTGALAQFVAERVMAEPVRSRLLGRGRGILAAGRAQVAAWLARHEGWGWTEPAASGMAFVSYPFDVPSETLVRELREAAGTFVCAGSWFGREGHLRIGFGVHPDELADGLERLARHVARYSDAPPCGA